MSQMAEIKAKRPQRLLLAATLVVAGGRGVLTQAFAWLNSPSSAGSAGAAAVAGWQ